MKESQGARWGARDGAAWGSALGAQPPRVAPHSSRFSPFLFLEGLPSEGGEDGAGGSLTGFITYKLTTMTQGVMARPSCTRMAQGLGLEEG